MKLFKTALVALTAVFIAGCNNDSEPGVGNDERRDIPLSREAEEVVNANNVFAFKLMDALIDEKVNVVISPISIYQYLSMIGNAAAGDTKKEIESLLGADMLSIEEINAVNSELVRALKIADKKTTVSLSNSLWYSKDIEMYPEYLSVLKNYYEAEVHALNTLDNNAAQREINRWCEKKTSGLIKQFLGEPLPSFVKYVAYNAAYFKGEWSTLFKTDAPGDFYNYDGTISTVAYMKAEPTCKYFTNKYFTNDGFEYIEIPYGNGAYAFSIVLQEGDRPVSLAEVDAILSEYELIGRSKMNVIMPKFKVSFSKEMNELLAAMGMSRAFSSDGDFSNASSYSQVLPGVSHAAVIEVDEKGTVAAASTGFGPTSVPSTVEVNRPFTFFIKETSTSTILFAGSIKVL